MSLNLLKPLFPAFPPRDFYSTSLTLEIRNRNLPVNLFYFGHFFFEENYSGTNSASSEKVEI